MTFPETIFINKWHGWFRGTKFPCSIGRGGINNVKTEGDGVTPAGVYSLENVFYRPDRVSRLLLPPQAIPIRKGYIWSDDPLDPHYNKLIANGTNWKFSHEKMFRADSLYDIVIPIAYNRADPEPDKGSAIFLHVWRGPRIPTEGCVAVDWKTMIWIAGNLTGETQIVINS